jgi:hypothetical protein
MGLVGFRRLHMRRAAGSERVRGRTPNIAPLPNPIRSERVISPAHHGGVAGRSPAVGVAGDATRLRLRGRLSPFGEAPEWPKTAIMFV